MTSSSNVFGWYGRSVKIDLEIFHIFNEQVGRRELHLGQNLDED